jgi:hypothetical protein
MEDWEQRIHSVLGDDSDRSGETALRYLAHLRRVLKFPLRVTGREDFPWEEPYVFGGWSKSEYTMLKKTHPSYTDIFDLIELLPPEEHEDVTAKIRRLSDKRTFTLGLSWLTTGQEDTPEFQILDDYATWHANY